MLLDLLTAVVVAYVGTNLLRAARTSLRGPARGRVVTVVTGLRPRHFLLAPPALAGVLAAFAALWMVPVLRHGWWSALGGTGNVAFGTTDRLAGTALAWLVPAVLIALLVPALPLLVAREEQAFRAGAEAWSPARRAAMGVAFGVVHLVAGVPLAAALALSVAGWWFTWVYLRAYRRHGRAGALLESTRVHLAYDFEIVALVAVTVALGAAA